MRVKKEQKLRDLLEMLSINSVKHYCGPIPGWDEIDPVVVDFHKKPLTSCSGKCHTASGSLATHESLDTHPEPDSETQNPKDSQWEILLQSTGLTNEEISNL